MLIDQNINIITYLSLRITINQNFLSNTSFKSYLKQFHIHNLFCLSIWFLIKEFRVVSEWWFHHNSLISISYRHLKILTNVLCLYCYHFFITKYTLGLLVWSLHLCYPLVSLESAFSFLFVKTSFIVVSMSRYYLCKFIKAYERGRVCV